jgi:hypothetical protein
LLGAEQATARERTDAVRFLSMLAVGVVGCGGSGSPKTVSAPVASAVVSLPPRMVAPADTTGDEGKMPEGLPRGARPLDVNFENAVRLVAYDIEPPVVHPGETTVLTFYWRCDATLDQGWMSFTHLRDDRSGKLSALDDDVGQGLEGPGPDEESLFSQWQKGTSYAKAQTYNIPADAGPTISVFVGIWKGDARLRIVAGPNDGENAAPVGKILVSPSRNRP